jgi:quinol---cytochrome c reductase iron-sulfur subunit, bacillus type
MAVAEVTEPGATRRRFHLGVIYSLWGIISAALSLPAFVYLFFPPRARHEDEWVEAGDISKLDPKAPMEMVFRRNRVDGWKLISEKSTAWVAKLADGKVVAYGPQCTHLGCAYHWDESKTEFICPCHSSIFSVDGKVVAGPAPRPLDRYETRVEGNKLMLGRLVEGTENNKA